MGLSNRFDPIANAEAGAELYLSNRDALIRRFREHKPPWDRDPEPWEIYLAHQQGVVGAWNILRNAADSTVPLTDGVYKNIAAQYRKVKVAPEDVGKEHAAYTKKTFESAVTAQLKGTKDVDAGYYAITDGYIFDPKTGEMKTVQAQVAPAPASTTPWVVPGGATAPGAPNDNRPSHSRPEAAIVPIKTNIGTIFSRLFN
jgi:hypothetical protein